jgi:hypothetical protein
MTPMNERNDRPSNAPIWSVLVRLDEVSDSGRHIELEAGADVRAALAKPLGVDAVERLTAGFDLTRRGRDGVHVAGAVRATVRQTCVVTLEPVLCEIDEEIDIDYLPPNEMRKTAETIDLEYSEGMQGGPDEPEALTGNSIDLGLLATEFVILGVDPYPRKPDAAFEPPRTAEAGAAHPFALLAGLNKKGTVKE